MKFSIKGDSSVSVRIHGVVYVNTLYKLAVPNEYWLVFASITLLTAKPHVTRGLFNEV